MIDVIIEEIKSYSSPEYVQWVSHILQVVEGGYGENDKLYGVKTPVLRRIAKKYSDISIDDAEQLIRNDYHEVRLVGVFILINYYKTNKYHNKMIIEKYLDNADYINNWDLVDLSAPYLLGDYVYNNKRHLNIIYKLSKEPHLWKQRIAIVATQYMIKKGFYEPTIKLAEQYLTHPHHLIHKATGWMLRELGKKDVFELYSFLDKYASQMPRTMLRYSIERLSKEDRNFYINKKSK